eukprot:CAMPEP_0170314932 /NCGR_PEP_ID=MMETSP0116_2-20130129/58051_1 /TAXON_ID=400756 /ORGANISM="Durinskia baltica, Strain CSIRO CS-38" /LENGTH=105 /DNA_ID=CAMNT_0010567405 /DNA_START=138 /DNA_END=451 /DNA_ORIENTATION=+
MPVQSVDTFAGVRVPHLGCVVAGRGNGQRTIRREHCGVDRTVMALQHPEALAIVRAPQSRHATEIGGQHHGAIGREHRRSDVVPFPLQLMYAPTGRDAPYHGCGG